MDMLVLCYLAMMLKSAMIVAQILSLQGNLYTHIWTDLRFTFPSLYTLDYTLYVIHQQTI